MKVKFSLQVKLNDLYQGNQEVDLNTLYGKRSFSVTTPCASPTRVDTERLAERETLLHRLGSKLNRTVLNSCGNSLSVAQITRDFFRNTKLRANGAIHTKKEAKQGS